MPLKELGGGIRSVVFIRFGSETAARLKQALAPKGKIGWGGVIAPGGWFFGALWAGQCALATAPPKDGGAVAGGR